MNAGALETLTFGDNCVLKDNAFSSATFGKLKAFTFKGTASDGNQIFSSTKFPELETFEIAAGSYMVIDVAAGPFSYAQFPKVTEFKVGDGAYICGYAFQRATFNSLTSLTLNNTSSYNNSTFYETKFPVLDSITFLNDGNYTYGGSLFRYSNLTELNVSSINFAKDLDLGSVFNYVKFPNVKELDPLRRTHLVIANSRHWSTLMPMIFCR